MNEKAILVGIFRASRAAAEDSLMELARLAETAGAVVLKKNLYEVRRIQSATYIGEGQAAAVADQVRELDADLVLFDEDLSPTQNRNLEELCGLKVVDRTGIILDIFARRARSQEGKIQVELAQLGYLLPRLVGRGEMLSRLAGGIGTRGPGETKLEIDRRRARERISRLKRQLEKLRGQREIHRRKRSGVPIPLVSLVGYTNAGKSTLMNRLTGAQVFVEDKLFATLDPTVRRLRLPSGREVLLSDTVGFVRKLPHQLVEAFRATFEEVAASDLLIHLIDGSDPLAQSQAAVVEQVLRELELDRKPILTVVNKIDVRGPAGEEPPEPQRVPRRLLPVTPHVEPLFVSALTGKGISAFLQTLEEKLSRTLRRTTLLIPHRAGGELSLLYRTSRVLKRKETSRGTRLDVELNEKYFNKFRNYQVRTP